MKGISIATDTVIYIIIGVMVLAVLGGFFMTYSGQAQSTAKDQTDRNNLCSQYLQADNICKNAPTGALSTDLVKVCGKLNTPGCTVGADPLPCIRKCCIGCP